MFTKSWSRVAYGIYSIIELLFLVILTGCGQTGCGSIWLSDIQVIPPYIPGGKTAQASIQVKRAPANAKFIWEGSGVEVSQESDRHLSVTITAPKNPGPTVIPATVTFKVQYNGRMDSRMVKIYVTPGGIDGAAARMEGSGPRVEEGGDGAKSISAEEPPDGIGRVSAAATKQSGSNPQPPKNTQYPITRPHKMPAVSNEQGQASDKSDKKDEKKIEKPENSAAKEPKAMISGKKLSTQEIAVSNGDGPQSPKATLPVFSVDPPFFFPSGWMGDGKEGEYVRVYPEWRENPHSSPTCYKWIYSGTKWAAVGWQYPDKNWGEKPGRNLKGYRKVTFWVRGEDGGELLSFMAGGHTNASLPYRSSFEAAIGPILLTKDWQKHVIDLKGKDLSSVICAFVWKATADGNPNGCTFYLDDIQYEQ